MRIKSLRISGLKCIAPCADLVTPDGDNAPIQLNWHQDRCELVFPRIDPMMAALIGPNSSGKSTVLQGLDLLFGSKSKLTSDFFNGADQNSPIIVEATLRGCIGEPDDWSAANCAIDGEEGELIIASVWQESRSSDIRRPDGPLHKIVTADKRRCEPLYPQYRLISANAKLEDEASPGKNNSVTDLIEALLTQAESASNRSILHKLAQHISDLEGLLDRSNPPNRTAWREVEALEEALSHGLRAIVPGDPRARIHLRDSVPDLQDIFKWGRVRIEDGIELDFEQQGLGIQRSFAVSVLRAWCEYGGCRQADKDYAFAVEEPEIYLHPHATRVLLDTLGRIAREHQVIFASHSPEFVNYVALDNVTSVRRVGNDRRFVAPDLSNLQPADKLKVQRYLQEDRSDMLFARAVLLVEGQAERFALPSMAAKLGVDLNAAGVSIVYSNGKSNFPAYHNILNAFGIPHVILADGDGSRTDRETEYRYMANARFVLDDDFEHLLATRLTDARLLEIVNECRRRIGKNEVASLPPTALTPENLKRQWWEDLRDHLNSDILAEHRDAYAQDRERLQQVLLELARDVVANGHTTPIALESRRAAVLRKLGKPLAGRVVGEMLTKAEVEAMNPIVDAIRAVWAQAAGT
ncbi:MAG: AAA family ATPase [Chloroflexi bacterium]|nr:AAA family ATPase [Chloroflexota bacterium]